MENPLFCDDNAALAPTDPNVIVLDLESKINHSIHLSWHSSTGDISPLSVILAIFHYPLTKQLTQTILKQQSDFRHRNRKVH
jgi:hypothetical protein